MKAVIIAAALLPLPAWADLFFDAGAGVTRVESKLANRDAKVIDTSSGAHLAFGARRSITERSDIAVRLELDDIDSNLLLAVRAFDYRLNLSDRLAWTAFIGAARLALGTPAYGYYAGSGVQLKQLLPHWDLNIDLRYGDRLARDNLLPSDPQGGSPDNFHAVYGLSIYFSRSF